MLNNSMASSFPCEKRNQEQLNAPDRHCPRLRGKGSIVYPERSLPRQVVVNQLWKASAIKLV